MNVQNTQPDKRRYHNLSASRHLAKSSHLGDMENLWPDALMVLIISIEADLGDTTSNGHSAIATLALKQMSSIQNLIKLAAGANSATQNGNFS